MRFLLSAIFLVICLLSSASSLDNPSSHSADKQQHYYPIVLDSHADTPLDFARGVKLEEYNPEIQVSIPRLKEGNVNAQYLACWVKQDTLTDEGRSKANARIMELIGNCYSQVYRNSTVCGLASSVNEVEQLVKQGKIAFLLGVENGYGIGLDLDVINKYKTLGVSYITLCHTKNNDICDSSSDKAGPKWHGLSPFGKEVIARMNSLGIIVDLSHASEETFWDVLKLSKLPVVCTHSASAAIFNHDRNLTDEQLRALAKNGGVVQVCAVDEFLCDDPKNASIDDFMRHLLHIIEVAGIDHVGIGTDFDGGGGVKGFNGSEEFTNVRSRLQEAGYSDRDINKIFGHNFLRVLDANKETLSF